MLKKSIAAVISGALLLGCATAPMSGSTASISLPDINIGDDQYFGAASDIEVLPPPEEFPINESIQGLDPSVIKIMIDPGHFSYYNRSPVYTAYWESVMTWKLSNYLQAELQALGVHADLTKSSLEEDPSLNDRGFMSKGYDFFISMHSNASNIYSMDAPMAFAYQDLPWTDIDDISREVGGLISSKTAEVMGTYQKGTVEQRKGTADHDRNGYMDDEWYSVLFGSRYVGTPGILMEHSFHTNYRSTVWLYNDENLKRLAKEEAKIFYDYFTPRKIAYAATATTTAATTTTTVTTTERVPREDPVYGNVNIDEEVNTTDASMVLHEYALRSTSDSGQGEFTEEQVRRADVDEDGDIDTNDASYILSFYTYLSTGGVEVDIRDWLADNKIEISEESTTTAVQMTTTAVPTTTVTSAKTTSTTAASTSATMSTTNMTATQTTGTTQNTTASPTTNVTAATAKTTSVLEVQTTAAK